jgi:hypothetical protein
MDSLFDASFFDTAPVAKPAEKPSAIVGQLDIFGNVVDLGDVVTADRVAKESVGEELVEVDPAAEVVAPEIDPLEAAELAGELPGAPIVVDPVGQAEAEALGVVRDLDPGDVLNDPTWEPDEPIDLDEIVAAFESPDDSTAQTVNVVEDVEPETDLFGGPISAAPLGQETGASLLVEAESDLFGEPINKSASPDEPETDLFGEPIVLTEPELQPVASEIETPTPEVVAPNVPIARPITEVVADQVDADGRRNRSVDELWELVIGQGSTVETLRYCAQGADVAIAIFAIAP